MRGCGRAQLRQQRTILRTRIEIEYRETHALVLISVAASHVNFPVVGCVNGVPDLQGGPA